MATNAELTTQVKQLKETIAGLQQSNNRLRDDVEHLKENYGKLVDGVNKNLESMVSRFQAQG
jgi:cell division protein FtsB|tara:strand:+ start:333 stop:518 length:186 start_codon:yes stop_codon:yes gene_type:complete